jgi:dipeptidyl aminopeptidase/acylaminoacyl peptidase
MKTKIADREEIKLSETQNKMLISGWGKDVFEGSVVERITYLSDNLKVKGYLAYPAEISDAGKFKLPCIMWNRGGYGNKGAIDVFNARGMFGQIASWGYVVFASQYRGNAGGEGTEQLGGDDVNDIINLMKLAGEISFADKDKWGIEGWSRGGMMTFLTLLKEPNFKCAVLSGAISNLKEVAGLNEKQKNYYENILGKDRLEQEIEKRSVINFTEKLPGIPYLILHGSEDDTVPTTQSIDLARKFQEMKFTYRLVIFENGDHYLKAHRTEVDRIRKMWFDKYLNN